MARGSDHDRAHPGGDFCGGDLLPVQLDELSTPGNRRIHHTAGQLLLCRPDFLTWGGELPGLCGYVWVEKTGNEGITHQF